jgi:hypothetical protein
MRNKMDLSNPETLTKKFLDIMQGFLDNGMPKEIASLSSAVSLVNDFTGKKKLNNFEIDYYSRIITAIVDGVLFLKN